MREDIRKRIDAVRRGEVPEGYSTERAILFPNDWDKPVALNTVLSENKDRNEDLRFGKEDVLSVSGEQGIVNQITLLGRSYAGESVAPYHVVETGDVVYTKSPLKESPYGIVKQNRGAPGIVSTLYAVYHCSTPITGQYLENYFRIDTYLNNYLKPLVKRGAKNDMKVNNEDVLLGRIPLPSLQEQERINEIIAQFDRVIDLKQKRVEELKQLKKACLTKMFPKGGTDVPELRFPGFTDPWEQRKLETAFDFSVSNNTLSRADLNYKDGEVKSVHYGDVLIKYSSVLDAQIDEIPFITGKKGMDFSGQWLQEGDIIIADTAEDETTGKATEIRHLGAIPVVSGLHTIVCRPTEKMAPYYLGYYLNSDSYHSQLLPLMQGIKVLSLSRSNLIKTEIKYPKSQEEQKQIGCFFRSLDNLIALHQRELEVEQRKKKALMKLLLTGLVRVNA